MTQWLTIAEAAALLRVSAQTVRRYIKAGILTARPGAYANSRVLVASESVDRLLGKEMAPAEAEAKVQQAID